MFRIGIKRREGEKRFRLNVRYFLEMIVRRRDLVGLVSGGGKNYL